MADDAIIAQAIRTKTRLGPGTYRITTPIVLGSNDWLRGSGVDTYLITDTPGLTMISITGSSAVIKDIHVGRFDWPTVMGVGISSAGLYDRTLIDNVWVDGMYDTACLHLSGGAASSSIRHSTFWNYAQQRFTAIFDSVSDWSNVQAEYHQQSPATNSAVVWITNGASTIRFFGGNISYKAGSGAPGHFDDAANARQLYGTTLYQEP